MSCGCRLELVDVARVIDGNSQTVVASKQPKGVDLVRMHHLVGNEDISDAGLGHDQRLPHRCAGDADCAGLDLHHGELRRLVHLDVGT